MLKINSIEPVKLLIIEFLSDCCDKCKSHKIWNRNVGKFATTPAYLCDKHNGINAQNISFVLDSVYWRKTCSLYYDNNLLSCSVRQWDNDVYKQSRAYLSHWVGSSAGTARGCGCGCAGVPISSAASAPSRCPQPACSGGLRAAPSTLLEHTAHTTALHLQLTQ